MNQMKIRAGARLNFTVTQADPSSVSATFIASNGTVVISDTQVYVNGVAGFEFNSPQTDTIGKYDYQVNENFATGSPDIYPSLDGCTGDCEFPTLEICESLEEGA